jgi:predicted phosphatase
MNKDNNLLAEAYSQVRESYDPQDIIYIDDIESFIGKLKADLKNGDKYETTIIDGHHALVKVDPMASIEAKRAHRMVANPSLTSNKDIPR